MNRNIRLTGLIITLIAAVLVAALPAAAKPVRIPFSGIEYTCSAEGGEVWMTRDGTMQHIRGQTLVDMSVTDVPFASGMSTHEVNMNMDLLSGNCTVWGKALYEVEGGSWRMNYSGRCTDFIYSGGGVGHGLGELEGWLMFLQVNQIDLPGDNPCPGGGVPGVYAYAVNGYIQAP
jgi:hypothetical protein